MLLFRSPFIDRTAKRNDEYTIKNMNFQCLHELKKIILQHPLFKQSFFRQKALDVANLLHQNIQNFAAADEELNFSNEQLTSISCNERNNWPDI